MVVVTNKFLTLNNFIHKSLHSSHECWSSSIVLFPGQIICIIIIIFQFLCFDRKRNSYSVLVLDHTSMKSQAAFLQQLLFVPQLSSQWHRVLFYQWIKQFSCCIPFGGPVLSVLVDILGSPWHIILYCKNVWNVFFVKINQIHFHCHCLKWLQGHMYAYSQNISSRYKYLVIHEPIKE